jgi:thiamine-phosphate pyrophosphorylase
VKALYVTDREAIGGSRLGAILSALSGVPGVTVVLRESPPEDRERLANAREARARLGGAVPLLVHRRFDVALAAGADGVHLPSDGLPVAGVRAHAPRGFRVGVSTHTAAEAERAIADGADLVVIGPVFDTPSKRRYGPPLGPAVLADLPPKQGHGAEVYAIGGVDESNLDALAPYADRISGIAAVRLFQESADPRALAARLAAR